LDNGSREPALYDCSCKAEKESQERYHSEIGGGEKSREDNRDDELNALPKEELQRVPGAGAGSSASELRSHSTAF
jgi:hypothetical protein